jgi:hypothetical protein
VNKNIRNAIVALATVFALTSCLDSTAEAPPFNQEQFKQDTQNYQDCMAKNGSFEKTRDGFSCDLGNKSQF